MKLKRYVFLGSNLSHHSRSTITITFVICHLKEGYILKYLISEVRQTQPHQHRQQVDSMEKFTTDCWFLIFSWQKRTDKVPISQRRLKKEDLDIGVQLKCNPHQSGETENMLWQHIASWGFFLNNQYDDKIFFKLSIWDSFVILFVNRKWCNSIRPALLYCRLTARSIL